MSIPVPEQNITLLDVQLARVYLPFLIELARAHRTMSYSDLVDAAKGAHPGVAYVQNAIPVSTGRRLEVIRLYCEKEDIPDLASLITNKESGECGSFYVDRFDPVAARSAVFARDWSNDVPSLDGYFDYKERSVKPRRARKVAEATQLMASFYRNNRERYPKGIVSKRAFIIDRLLEGLDPEEVFQEALAELSESNGVGGGA